MKIMKMVNELTPVIILISFFVVAIVPDAMAGGVVVADIYSYPETVVQGEVYDVTVRFGFVGDDEDGPWLVTDLDLSDDDDGIGSNNANLDNLHDDIRALNDIGTIASQDVWYYYTFYDVDLSAYDDDGDGVELFVWVQVDDNDWYSSNPDGASGNYQVTVLPAGNSGPGPSFGNTSAQEYGDALYDNFTFVGYNYNHAGLFSGLDANGAKKTFESSASDFPEDLDPYGSGPQEGNFDTRFTGASYYGAFNSSDYPLGMPFSKRRGIVGKAKDVVDEYIGYPLITLNALNFHSGSTAPLDPYEISSLRCDGLVEYAYERNDIRVWRNCTKPDNEWNIAYYPDSHNDNMDNTRDPHFELSPWAQRGAPPSTGPSVFGDQYSGPPWPDTRMTLAAVVENPSHEVEVLEITETYMDIRLRATDESGIWGFMYILPGETSWVTGRNPNRHPVSDTYTRDVRLSSEGELTVIVFDQGGNDDFATYDIAFLNSDGDLDDDGLPDWWEEEHFDGETNANPNATCSNGVNTVRQAYVAGLDPNDPDSAFLTSIFLDKVLRWSCVSGRVYSVWWTTNLLESFQPLETNLPWTQGSYTNPDAPPCSYYKIKVELEE